MKRWLLLPLVLVLATCTQPTTDPDAAVRALLADKTWLPTGTNSEHGNLMYFYSDGHARIGSSTSYSWSYKSSVLTINGPNGTDTTSNPAVTATTLTCTYAGYSVDFVKN